MGVFIDINDTMVAFTTERGIPKYNFGFNLIYNIYSSRKRVYDPKCPAPRGVPGAIWESVAACASPATAATVCARRRQQSQHMQGGFVVGDGDGGWISK